MAKDYIDQYLRVFNPETLKTKTGSQTSPEVLFRWSWLSTLREEIKSWLFSKDCSLLSILDQWKF